MDKFDVLKQWQHEKPAQRSVACELKLSFTNEKTDYTVFVYDWSEGVNRGAFIDGSAVIEKPEDIDQIILDRVQAEEKKELERLQAKYGVHPESP